MVMWNSAGLSMFSLSSLHGGTAINQQELCNLDGSLKSGKVIFSFIVCIACLTHVFIPDYHLSMRVPDDR